MLHRLFLRLCRNDLFTRSRLSRFFATDFCTVRFKGGLLDFLFLKLQGVAHFFAREFLGQQFFHTALVILGQLNATDVYAAHQDAVRCEFGFQFGFNLLLNFTAFSRKDFTYRIAREYFVDHALHRRLDHFFAQIFGHVFRKCRDFFWIKRVAQREINAER